MIFKISKAKKYYILFMKNTNKKKKHVKNILTMIL